MTAILTGDLHLTDDPNQDYRFGLFPWLRERARRYKVAELLILGDLTEEKDRHSSVLVNRITRELARLAKLVQVTIVRGNHDGLDPNTPFFEFVKRIPQIRYIKKATFESHPIFGPVAYLPHSRHPQQDYGELDYSEMDYAFIHQTVDGALAENGMNLSGIPRGLFRKVGHRVFSGDVHVPQDLGKVTYVGAPYHIKFADKFDPRVLLLNDDGSTKDLHFPSPRKWTVRLRSAEQLKSIDGIATGDHVKVVVRLKREEYVDYDRIRAAAIRHAEKHGWHLFGVSLQTVKDKPKNGEEPIRIVADPGKVVASFCDQEKVEKPYRTAGLWYVNEGRGASKTD